MKSFNLAILLIILNTSFFSQKKETIKIPKGIVYNYCNPKLVEKAKVLIKENLIDSLNYDLIGDNLIIGPSLWTRLKENNKINDVKGKNVDFYVDELILKGKFCQDRKDSKIIWNIIRNEIASDFKIRKANEQELVYYWAIISFDIEEPLLILETKDHNYVLNLQPKDLKLFWLDEVPNYQNGTNIKYKNGKEVVNTTKGEKETGLESITLLSSDKVLKENTSVEDLKTIIDETQKVFDELFLKSDKSGKIKVHFELKKEKNEISFSIKDDIDLEIMKEFEQRVVSLKLPNSKKETINFEILFKVNSFNEN